MRHAIAGALTAAVVIVPQDFDTGTLDHIQQTFLMTGQHIIIMRARHTGKHTGNRNRRCRTAGCGMREIRNVIFFQQRIGFTLIA